MAGQEISKKDSKEFLDRFSKEHLGCKARLETSAAGGQGLNLVANDLPLTGISLDEGGELSVMLGGRPGLDYGHNIPSWSRLSIINNDCLEIVSEDGTVTRLCCTGPSKVDSGQPGGGAGRADIVGRSGVYPMSRPEGASPDAILQPEATWGQGDRGPEGYFDAGSSEIHPPGSREPEELTEEERREIREKQEKNKSKE